ncbi:DUF4214 domain-containing protein [Serratia entomophila]|uniref:DUF4214 domain-containing protein n=1 Tax=Serratia entomophila TaxID=42906 RepID=UPI00217B0654|nr:DUF4214 domain-containing protein [Serratia entomophila]CAI0821924.1 ABC-type protease/lipase transport system, ATPase and permease components [Serratia entomophila]CAI1541071.1 ABC-type protease/lipase transport system, ATPase and permease components [Serratia entomophila]CAI1550029.1 ABC-type protease/lipase transport system, ATPase and permease components [Serratia entomophila]CAI1635137.1 ABC-type protease/lipase transport system, ATPase and permease components [Serratia entomophila]CAI
MASLNFQKEAAALLYSVLGENASPSTFDAIGHSIETGQLSAEDYVGSLLNSAAGVQLYAGKSDLDILSSIYSATYGKAAPEDYLSGLLANANLETSVATLVNTLLNYSGFDADMLASQASYDEQLNLVLYPSYELANGAAGTSDVMALYYLAGVDPVMGTVYSVGEQINAGTTSFAQAASQFVNGRPELKSLTNDAFVKLVFSEGYGRAATSAELNSYTSFLANGGDRGQLMVNIINELRGTVGAGDKNAQQQFLHDTTPHAPGVIADLAAQEQVASIFLSIPERNVDAQGLDDWSSYLGKNGNTQLSLTAKLITSVEFQQKGAQLSGNDYIQHVYTAVHGVPATAMQLAQYAKLGADKALITTAIINDLRSSTATDAVTVTQQHAFEYDIGTSLTYKTAATLSASAAGGNATGTVNTGASHVLTNAETAVLVNAVLNADAATTVNLKFADHLANLTINGNKAATVNLSDNGVNPGVDITVNNGNVTLNASSGNDDVQVTSAANIAAGIAKFNLGAGNDSLKWGGNATNGYNVVSSNVRANGGEGVDTISANFITKQLTTTSSSFLCWTTTKSTISTNAGQFTSFEKIDLGGYIGGTSATLNGKAVSVNSGHQFDYGVINGQATANEIGNVDCLYNVSPSSTLGKQGFVLSGFADNVHVINVSGGSVAQLEVTGDATASSSVDFTFLQDATNKFDINFTAVSDADVNAGTIKLASSSSNGCWTPGTALSTVNVNSGGVGDFSNILKLAGSNSQVTKVNIAGDHQLELQLGAGYSNVRTIDASANTHGVDITSSVGGTGEGCVLNLLDLLPFNSITKPLAGLFGFKNDELKIIGTNQADTFSVVGNTTVTGGAGADTFKLVSSTANAAVTIKDFNTHEDTLVDVKSGLALSDSDSGTRVADYGYSSNDVIKGILGSALTCVVSAKVDFFKMVLGIQKESLSHVGVVGTSAGSYVIVDQNGNGSFDNHDTISFLQGVSHNDAAQMYYASSVTTNGVQQQSGELAFA